MAGEERAMSIDFERERAWWDAKAPFEESDRADAAINRALRWRELERHLAEARTVLDVGGGTGAFSIPLARRTLQVTHLDLSPAMLELARAKACDLPNIRFVEGNAADLSCFPDREFDLVLATDGAISFCGPLAEQALAECCRVTRETLFVTVLHRASLVPVWIRGSIQIVGRLVPAVEAMATRGEWRQDQYPENAALTRGCTQDYTGPIKAFLPGELRALIEGAGLGVLRCGGLGSLANLVGEETVARVLDDENLLAEFLDECERYDWEILPDGPGTRGRCGLVAVARRLAS
jgi:SAM-dependent methyltransferase